MFRDALLSRGSHPPASGNQQQQAQDKKKSAKKTGKPTGSRALRPGLRSMPPSPKQVAPRPHHARADRGSLVETQIQQWLIAPGGTPNDRGAGASADKKCAVTMVGI